MDKIYSFAPFVEFVGAFCFAFVITNWSDKLFKHILNVGKMFNVAFEQIQSDIEADRVSIENMEPLVLEDHRSTEKELSKLKRDYIELFDKKCKVKESCSNYIESYHQPHFARQLFLMSGLYTVVDILVMCLIKFFDSDNNIVQSIMGRFSFFNLIVILFFVYFVVAEILYWVKKGKVCRFWIPPFLKVIIVMTLMVISCVFLPVECWINYDTSLVCVILPVMPFVFCFLLSSVMYCCSKKKVHRDSQVLIERFEELHSQKNNFDKLYALFDRISFDKLSD